jgi:hypothetical protein
MTTEEPEHDESRDDTDDEAQYDARMARLILHCEPGLDAASPTDEEWEWMIPEQPAEVTEATYDPNSRYYTAWLLVQLKLHGLRRIVALLPRERWEAALDAVYPPPG